MDSQKVKEALARFRGTCNCCQAVVTPWAGELGEEEKTLFSLGAGFGGGMGRLQEACGAFTGGVMVLGAFNAEKKDFCYEQIRSLGEAVIREFGSLRCRDLLGVDLNDPISCAETLEKRDYKEICPKVIAFVTAYIEQNRGK
ncbi:MAG TPA: C_GCAxxG_C_C family protein [Firmicutes bacterium]|nr:C_GCAxxG_C_C family protein [Bacillota bacterium]